MKNNTKVKILSGSDRGSEGFVSDLNPTGSDRGKVQVYLIDTGKFRLFKKEELQSLPNKVKIGDRIQTINLSKAVKNVPNEATGVVIADPKLVANLIRVKIQLDDGQILSLPEDNLEVISSPEKPPQKKEKEERNESDTEANLRRRELDDYKEETKSKKGNETTNTNTGVKIDPEFKSLITPLTPEERSLLEADLIEHGCLDPLIVWEEENVFLDGHNRHEICSQHKIKYQLKYLSFRNRRAAKDWIIIHQLARRNLTNEAVSYYRGKIYNSIKNKVRNPTGQNQHCIDDINQLRGQNVPIAGINVQATKGKDEQSKKNTEKGRTSEQLGAEYRVNSKTIKRDGEYAVAIDTLARTVDSTEFRPTLLSKKYKLSKTDARKLASLAIEHPEIVRKAYNSDKSGKDWLRTVQYKTEESSKQSREPFPYQKGDVVIVRATKESEPAVKARSGYWAIVKEVRGRFACSVLVYDGILDSVRATELEEASISGDLKKSAIALMERLQKIAEIEKVDPMMSDILCGVGKRRIFDLTPVQNKILNAIEEELGIKNRKSY